MEFIIEPERKTPIIARGDVVVVGGGPAGIGAALRAARSGANTILIEKFGVLGGTNTAGFMVVVRGERQHIAAEIFDRLRPGGYIVNLMEKFPGVTSNPLNHWGKYGPLFIPELLAFDPDMCSHVLYELMGETNVKLFMGSQFVDTQVEGTSIRSVIIENTSGRQAVEGKVFIDATGRGDVAARSGVPYTSARNELGVPMPPGLMWKMSGVDYQKLLEYQKEDPKLDKLINKAKTKGESPYSWSPKSDEAMRHYDVIYTGHSRLEMCPLVYPGDLLLWMPAMHDLGLDCAEKAEDFTRAEIEIRKQIVAELNFLKKYVPGFENAHLGGIAPALGVREGRHPVGEYVLTFDDIKNSRKFDDVALRLRANDIRIREFRELIVNIPYRCFLPKNIDNLLLAGDDLSVDHGAFLHTRNFGNAISLGEVAGIAAFVSVENRVKPKELEYSMLKKELFAWFILTE